MGLTNGFFTTRACVLTCCKLEQHFVGLKKNQTIFRALLQHLICIEQVLLIFLPVAQAMFLSNDNKVIILTFKVNCIHTYI
jgi:hypothetical protein